MIIEIIQHVTKPQQDTFAMQLQQLRDHIKKENLVEEHDLINKLVFDKCLTKEQRQNVIDCGCDLVQSCRDDSSGKGTLDSFLLEFGLSNNEGVGLMCLAEALLRVPDSLTADRLIAEKIHNGDWASHSGNSESLFVNASTWGLMLTGHMVYLDPSITEQPGHWVRRLTAVLGEPIIRRAVLQAMKIMGGQYVLGRDIEEGMKRGQKENAKKVRFSFDMLGEAARTESDAQRYFKSYSNAIESIGASNISSDVYDANGISIKLSALHARYHFSHQETVMKELLPRITDLCLRAKKHNIGLSIDAEEAARLDMSLDIFEELARNPGLKNWDGLGFVLQAYQKRAPLVVKWLIQLGKETSRRLMVRLVKGAYWDAEIKHAQEQGHKDYPVFTRKANTDLGYLACAKILLNFQEQIFPQFATHNAYTASAIIELAKGKEFEFQRLHGMGHLLYNHLLKKFPERETPLRIYAPIGEHQDLLPYLVRRLLENGANSSFVNRFLDKKMPAEELIKDIYDQVTEVFPYTHASIPNPKDIYEYANEQRENAKGIDLNCKLETAKLIEEINNVNRETYAVGSIVNGTTYDESGRQIDNPTNHKKPVGTVAEASNEIIEKALDSANLGQPAWQKLSPGERGKLINRVADQLETNMNELVGLIVLEAGRTIADGVSEVREAIDFCRYYALQAEQSLVDNSGLKARGIFFCISPWNFPLAIFVGQIAAALAAGNAVIAKPAEQTPLIASRAVKLFHQAGVPLDVLHLLTGNGVKIGRKLLSDPRIDGICFTGSTETAQLINQQIAARPGVAIPFIAETGGQNCMIVDSTALPEQVVDDVIASSFMSAGQRCSALRVLFLQKDIADKVLHMLDGAMQSIVVGEPYSLSTDVGPVIDQKARDVLQAHADKISQQSKFSASVPVSSSLNDGNFFAPRLFEIDSLEQLEREVFGPILHVIRFSSNELDKVIAQINNTGYGLTLGVHSRIEAIADYVFRKTNIGNTYINRNIVGAVVGVHPFGGTYLSGTGPKAGGPNYIYRFCRSVAQPIQPGVNPIEMNLGNDSLFVSSAQNDVIERAVEAQLSLKKVSAERRAGILSSPALANIVSSDLIQYFNTLCKLTVEKLGQPHPLPGTTGEENFLYTQAKGVVLSVVSDMDSVEHAAVQIGIVLATGCSTIIVASQHAHNRIKPLMDALNTQGLPINTLQIQEPLNLGSLISDSRLCAVTVTTGEQDFGAIKRLLAARKGAIAPLVELPAKICPKYAGAIYSAMTYLIIEKTKTENLVARGGNTQLFNLQE